MTRPPRLLDSSSNDSLRELLAAGLDDAPDADALPKVAAALGLAATTVVASSLAAGAAGTSAALTKGAALTNGAALTKGAAIAGSAPAAVAGQAAASAGAGFWGGNSALALGKTLLVSMVSAGTLSAGAVAVHEYTSAPVSSIAVGERAHEAPPASADRARGVTRGTHTQQAPTAGTPAVAATTTPVSETARGAAASDSRPVRQGPGITARSEGNGKTAPTAADTTSQSTQRTGVLAREVRQIDSARQALESRNADSALAALEGYERSRVVGVLDREALLLKIEALLQKQDLERAKVLARQYVEHFPTDTHAPRLRALMSSTSSSVRAFPHE